MIIQLRLDERLIHGQIVTSWSNVLGIDTIVVANDKVAKNELDKNLLMMAAPANKKVTIRTVENTIKLLSDPRADKMGILLICGTPADAVALVKGLSVKDVNIANYRKKKSPDKVTINVDVYADKEDFQIFEELCHMDVQIFSQLLPSLPKDDFREQMKKARRGIIW